jgi:hypothetical protein
LAGRAGAAAGPAGARAIRGRPRAPQHWQTGLEHEDRARPQGRGPHAGTRGRAQPDPAAGRPWPRRPPSRGTPGAHEGAGLGDGPSARISGACSRANARARPKILGASLVLRKLPHVTARKLEGMPHAGGFRHIVHTDNSCDKYITRIGIAIGLRGDINFVLAARAFRAKHQCRLTHNRLTLKDRHRHSMNAAISAARRATP